MKSKPRRRWKEIKFIAATIPNPQYGGSDVALGFQPVYVEDGHGGQPFM
jgi:hypothetical protein